MSLAVALLTSMVILNLPSVGGDQVFKLYRLQVQQRRVREMIDRDRRLRQYLRRRKAFLLSSVTAALSFFTTTRNRHVWVRNCSSEQNLWSSVELYDDDDERSFVFPGQLLTTCSSRLGRSSSDAGQTFASQSSRSAGWRSLCGGSPEPETIGLSR